MKDLFYLMEFICLVIAMETFKNRLKQRVINKKKFKKILPNGYKKKQMRVNRGPLGGLIGVYFSSIV